MDVLANQPERELSPRVIRLARAIDRLPPGDYIVQLSKPCDKQQPMEARINQLDLKQVLRLDN